MRKIAGYVIALLLLAVPAVAQSDIYDNGPPNGTSDGWTINFGFIVSNSFTLGSFATITNMTFAAWLTPGDVLESVDVSITSSEFGGTAFLDETVNFTQSGCVSNQYGFNVCDEFGDIRSDPSLNAGTYWLNLQNAVVNTGDPVYWDENSGPSQASENTLGTIPSESFTLGGGCGAGKNSPDCGPPSTPEPSSLLLFGSGIVAVVGALRRSMRR